MFDFLDVVKWKNPQNAVEKEDVMVVEDTEGIYSEVRHVCEEGFSDISYEPSGDLKKVGKCTAYDKASEIVEKYKNL
jgi:hypothetical protein